jgi:hypothetical protein
MPMMELTSGTMQHDGILAIWHDCTAGRENDIESWYQTEHLAERLAVPGFRLGRRHEAVSGSSRYFTFYVTDSPEVLTSAPYLERLNNPTPFTRKIMTEVFRNMSRTICRRVERRGFIRGAFAVTARFSAPTKQDALTDALGTFGPRDGVSCAELWSSAETPMRAATEEQLRGGDRKIHDCLLFETLRLDDAERVARRLADQFGATADIGTYRFLCEQEMSPA